MKFLIHLFLFLATNAQGVEAVSESEQYQFKNRPPKVYEIKIDGKLSGFCIEHCETRWIDGKSYLIITSRTKLETGAEPFSRITTSWILTDSRKVHRFRIEVRQGKTLDLREAVFEKGRVNIRTANQEGSAPNKELVLPENYAVPYCHAHPAHALMGSGIKEIRLNLFNISNARFYPVIVKHLGQTELSGGDPQKMGDEYIAEWQGENRSTRLWVNGQGDLLRAEQLKTGITINLASEDVARKMIQNPPAPSGFFPVKQDLGDRAALTYLAVKMVIFNSGVKSKDQLQGPGQSFEGELTDGKIEGVFKIHGLCYLYNRAALDFPVTPEEIKNRNLTRYIEPELGIETDKTEIRDTAKEITSNLKYRRHAVHALGAWVKENISFLPTGSDTASLALQSKKANAIGTARLYTALCRSVGIPSRIINGGLYVRHKDKTGFAKHYWSEVYMGEAGWRLVDPSAGQISFIDAGHICLGESGSFNAVEIVILDYIPKPKTLLKPLPLTNATFPLSSGETLHYSQYFDNKSLGAAKITFHGREKVHGNEVLRINTEVNNRAQKGTSTILVGEDGRVYFYKSNFSGIEHTCTIEPGLITTHIKKNEEVKRLTAPLPKDGLFIDGRHPFQLGFLVSRLDLKQGDTLQVEAFNQGMQSTILLQIRRKYSREMAVLGAMQKVNIFEVLIGFSLTKIILTEDGCLVEAVEHDGMLRYVLDRRE